MSTRTRTTFCLEPQRSSPRGWVACAPHEAVRWAIFKVQNISRKGHRSHQVKRMVASVAADRRGARDLAENILAQYIANSKKRPQFVRRAKALYRSLTGDEYRYWEEQREGSRHG